MEVDDISGAVVTEAIAIHRNLGSSLFESVYEVLLARSLHRRGLRKQLLTYLRLMNLRVGLLLNFGAATMLAGLKRIVNDYPR